MLQLACEKLRPLMIQCGDIEQTRFWNPRHAVR